MAGLLLPMMPRGAAAQSPGCQITQTRTVLYDTVPPGTPLGNSVCRFTARVIDQTIQTCTGSAALVLSRVTSDYPIIVNAPSGNGDCTYYKPLYTAWCHGGTPPDATTPDNLTASLVPGGGVQLAWRDNSGNCSCQGEYCPASPLRAWQWFDIWRRTSSVVGYSLVASIDASATSYVDQGAPPGQQAFYSVGARDASGVFLVSSAEAAATANGSGPSAPSFVSASALQGGVLLTWVDTSTSETGFRVERKTYGGAWTTIATLPANATAVIDDLVEAGVWYQYRVVAYNQAGASPSAEVWVNTP